MEVFNMFTTFLRENKYVSYLLTILRVYLGWNWMTAGYGKITGGFDASGYLKNAVANPVLDKATGEPVYGGWVSFLENFALPNIELFNVLVPWGEFLVGLGLILGGLTTAAMFFGLLMNFSFFFSGTVSHNPSDILLGMIILVAGFNAGKIGIDRWIIPFIRKFVKEKFGKKTPKTEA